MLARKSLLLFVTHVANALLGLASIWFVARLMGPEALGTIGYVMGLLGMFAMFSDLGFRMAHVKRVSEGEDVGQCVGAFLLVEAILVAPIVFFALLASPVSQRWGTTLFENEMQRGAFYFISLMYILNNFALVPVLTFEATRETAKVSLVSLVSSLVTALAKIAVAVLALGVVALSGAYMLEAATTIVVALLLFRGYRPRRPGGELLRRYLVYALPLMGIIVTTSFLSNVDRVLINTFWGATEVGYYFGIQGMVDIMNKISSAGMKLFFPKTSEDAAQGNIETIKARLFLAEKYLLTVVVAVVVGVIAFRELVIRIILGAQFLPAAPTLAVFALFTLALAISRPYGNIIYAIEKHRYLMIGTILNLLVLVVADLVFIPEQLFGHRMLGLGGVGAALGLLVGTMAAGAFQIWLVKKFTGIGFFWRAWRFLGAGLAMYAFLTLAVSFVPVSPVLQAILLGPVGALVYLLCLVALGEFNGADARFFFDLANPAKMTSYVFSELKVRRDEAEGEP